MFFKQYNYKPRSNSQSSQGSAAGSPPKDDTKATTTTGPAASAAIAGRRRSSASAEKFAGLTGQKRASQDDRKASWNDQKPGQPGILGGMWQNFTKGS
ncbi:hypothetical protein AYL99_10795 [Fonsecaea erecta]|uniref:Uncharacterized protein n=1 Tax=Fonsecaea erecta TaxID=1367422 RepID=A0A178Z7S4_9EURO|nr:hypothetical protein AYL99_10795 [Fonsecaea erecta]OAP55095.1 hypothetical protein AYL99_10795 [Fonsecaea erecta]